MITRKRRNINDNIIASLSFCLVLLLTKSAGQQVAITVGTGYAAESFQGRLADFGSDQPFAYDLNLVLPPADQPQLCNYPKDAMMATPPATAAGAGATTSLGDSSTNLTNVDSYNGTDTEFQVDVGMQDVAILVSYGECLPSEKAIVAAALQQNATTEYGRVTHLIIYNTDRKNMDNLYTLTAGAADEQKIGVSIFVIFVSTRTGLEMNEMIMQAKQRNQYANPNFLGEGNELWSLPVSFETVPYVYDTYAGEEGEGTTGDSAGYNPMEPVYGDFPPYPDYTSNGGNVDAEDFYWFRLIIFSLLVVSPCFRAVFLWYQGGARIRFRYNEQGRIVGLQYIPPMPYWFTPRADVRHTHQASCMTEEEVMALPEIVYGESDSPAASVDEDATAAVAPELGTDERNKESYTTKGNTTIDNSATIETDTQDNGRLECAVDTSNALTSPTTDEEQPLPPTAQRNPSEMHSTCPICIEDFERGEKLRMLPRCRHIFHTDCILPWLTERQGCCPLCKTEVIEPEGEVDENENGDEEDRRSADYSESDEAAGSRPART